MVQNWNQLVPFFKRLDYVLEDSWVEIKFSIVERPNNRNYIIYDEKISGKDNAIQYLLDNPDIADRIFSEVRDCYLNKKEIISAQPEGSMEENPLIDSIEGA